MCLPHTCGPNMWLDQMEANAPLLQNADLRVQLVLVLLRGDPRPASSLLLLLQNAPRRQPPDLVDLIQAIGRGRAVRRPGPARPFRDRWEADLSSRLDEKANVDNVTKLQV